MSEKRPIIIALVVVGLAIVGLVIYSKSQTSPEPEVTARAIDIPIESPKESPKPVEILPEPVEVQEVAPVEIAETKTEPAFVLPLLDDSDQLIRDGVVSLTRNEGINAWLAPSQLIRKAVAFVDALANGQVVKDPVRVLAPQGSFQVRKVSDQVYEIDEASYHRYDQFTRIVVSIDSKRAAEFYHLISPMLQQAYGELGYRNKKFDDVVFKAIGRLLETPVFNEPVRLVRPVVMYQFENKKLESLSSAQKQLIRMGPKNTRALQVKLGEIALELRSILENG